jgi:hypothetical protein
MEDSECAICFDTVTAEEQLSLPCQCHVLYCHPCWDRALAAAFNDSGVARCPTCRTPVRVDFDPEASSGRGGLIFSAAGGVQEQRSQVVSRLAEAAAPTMTRLLRQYGAEHPMLRRMALEPAAMLETRSMADLTALLQALSPDATAVEPTAATDPAAKRAVIEQLIENAGPNGSHSNGSQNGLDSGAVLAALCATWDDERDPSAGHGARCVCGGRSSIARPNPNP